ncbi:hypothetical protein KSC_022430 [Ktedonobacter sp. SOSP1-52]|nr:hypothetical protein KSC_022430 [Ktedonobacter sp. SOSP1-52]
MFEWSYAWQSCHPGGGVAFAADEVPPLKVGDGLSGDVSNVLILHDGDLMVKTRPTAIHPIVQRGVRENRKDSIAVFR